MNFKVRINVDLVRFSQRSSKTEPKHYQFKLNDGEHHVREPAVGNKFAKSDEQNCGGETKSKNVEHPALQLGRKFLFPVILLDEKEKEEALLFSVSC